MYCKWEEKNINANAWVKLNFNSIAFIGVAVLIIVKTIEDLSIRSCNVFKVSDIMIITDKCLQFFFCITVISFGFRNAMESKVE